MSKYVEFGMHQNKTIITNDEIYNSVIIPFNIYLKSFVSRTSWVALKIMAFFCYNFLNARQLRIS
jgi:hypothetical protein